MKGHRKQREGEREEGPESDEPETPGVDGRPEENFPEKERPRTFRAARSDIQFEVRCATL